MLKKLLSPQKILAATLLCCSFNAFALEAGEKDIIINKDFVNNPKIAIAKFIYKDSPRPNYNIEEIIYNDLSNSGKFEPLKPNKFPQSLSLPLDRDLWLEKEVPLIVTGEVEPIILKGEQHFRLHYKLFDVSGNLCSYGKPCLDNEITLNSKEVRDLGHTAANNIYQAYYEEENGDFLSKVAYIYQKDQGVSGYKLVVSDYDGYNPKVIYSSSEPLSSPTWSHDNSSIAFSAFGLFSSNILEYNFYTKKIKVLVKKLGNNSSPTYSPDGKYIAYTHTENGESNIFIKNLITGKEYKITSFGRNSEPTWYGDSIIFTSDRSGVAAIYQSSLDGSQQNKISNTSGQTTNAKVSYTKNLLVMINNDRIISQDLKTGEIKQLSNTLFDESVTLSPNGTMAIYSYSNYNLGSTKRLNLVTTDGTVKIPLAFPRGDTYYPAWSK